MIVTWVILILNLRMIFQQLPVSVYLMVRPETQPEEYILYPLRYRRETDCWRYLGFPVVLAGIMV